MLPIPKVDGLQEGWEGKRYGGRCLALVRLPLSVSSPCSVSGTHPLGPGGPSGVSPTQQQMLLFQSWSKILRGHMVIPQTQSETQIFLPNSKIRHFHLISSFIHPFLHFTKDKIG